MGDIVIARHGYPDVDWSPRLSTSGFRCWTLAYDEAPLRDDSFPDETFAVMAQRASQVFCSGLRRSLETYRRCGGAIAPVSDPLFNEIRLSVPVLPFVRMRPYGWVLLSTRILRAGIALGSAGQRAGKARASDAANMLVESASRHDGITLLVGHGTMNEFIQASLLSGGWHCVGESENPRAYWGWRRYSI